MPSPKPHPTTPSGFLEGDLKVLSVLDLTRFFGSGGHQVRVEILAETTEDLVGEMWFEDCLLADCRLPSESGAGAFFALLKVESGTFRVHHEEPPPDSPSPALSWKGLLLEDAMAHDRAQREKAGRGAEKTLEEEMPPESQPLLERNSSGGDALAAMRSEDGSEEVAAQLDALCQQESNRLPLLPLLGVSPG